MEHPRCRRRSLRRSLGRTFVSVIPAPSPPSPRTRSGVQPPRVHAVRDSISGKNNREREGSSGSRTLACWMPDQVRHDGVWGIWRTVILPKPPQFFPTLHPRAIILALPLPDGSRTFRCRWEGMPPDLVRKRQRVGQGEAMANAVPLAGGAFERRAKPATGPVPTPPAASGQGGASGPGLWRTC